MTRMLIVPSPSLSPLSTSGPVPTDGQLTWGRCSGCGARGRKPVGLCLACEVVSVGMVPDGPYPYPAAVWQEVWRCVDACHSAHWPGAISHQDECEEAGAVVATVEVTGRGHHGYECDATPCYCDDQSPCLPCSRWHTPTSAVTRLDVPIPMERPYVTSPGSPFTAPTRHDSSIAPAPWWWADLEVPA